MQLKGEASRPSTPAIGNSSLNTTVVSFGVSTGPKSA
jgi:hypothetical protein